MSSGERADYNRLEAHLRRYTARNTFDYFIHKDLGAFLRRELDFYIKNEVMHLDDIEDESAPRVDQYLSKLKVIRKIAGKIIDFLAQLEDFQKKLWLKKKFVVETSYCITLDRIPVEFYPEIAANDAQRQEWVKLFAIDEVEPSGEEAQDSLFAASTAPYSVPLTVEFLHANQYLPLDTRFFGARLHGPCHRCPRRSGCRRGRHLGAWRKLPGLATTRRALQRLSEMRLYRSTVQHLKQRNPLQE